MESGNNDSSGGGISALFGRDIGAGVCIIPRNFLGWRYRNSSYVARNCHNDWGIGSFSGSGK